MKQQAPQRWSDELSGGAPESMRAMLAAARNDGPSAAQLERLIASVSAPVPPTPPTSSALPLWTKGGTAVLVLASLGAWLSMRAPAPQVARDETPSPLAAPLEAPERAPVQTPALVGPAPEVPTAPPAAPTRATTPKASRRSAASAPETRSAADDIVLLQRAKRSLPAAPSRALELLGAHARDFPDSAFTEEREALSIEAQLKVGRDERARAELEQFKARYPRSAYLRRLETLPFTVGTQN